MIEIVSGVGVVVWIAATMALAVLLTGMYGCRHWFEPQEEASPPSKRLEKICNTEDPVIHNIEFKIEGEEGSLRRIEEIIIITKYRPIPETNGNPTEAERYTFHLAQK